MSKVLVFGHQNPDTDTIASAISMAYLQQQLGVDAEAVALGEMNEETAYALNEFGVEPLRIIDHAKSETSQVMLVDHNEAQQSVSDIKEVEVLAVVDHHRIANFETANPLYYRAEPVGCTNTIIYKMYQEHGITIPKEVAGLMLSAIISDTLLFKSPTCTSEDVNVAEKLATIAEVDMNVYGLNMLKAGTNLGTKSDEDLLNMDAKSFNMGDKVVRIGQVNTVDVQDVLSRQASVEAAMTSQNQTEGYDLFVLIITNILDSDSVILVVGEPKENVEKAFNVTLENNTALLKGVVSRKKQVVPQLTESF
ncbi:manganese-dependent inorganic pyrophosphatase [Vagococcus xieshaowenii]|uniref:Probable manganese-dependent inorganic pyrophosphatase n=1 Tax=Vagococcus xieshaowenii TaxID=2562451 RepID=A0AAJ5EFF9_9ENTE|nr:manganese-dependent inorganic pyrophosphatase [Vagococcus xieshaowenii]QCA28563.1 manganese-dependent inorganic pyrophosphatase [Vagococcus xieshaowenii]TFZ40629.1 manganese-dependent inorganic pyrophosphatase [Vagococcus xieshaowenii]